jgi:hypothetical protein
MVRLSRVFATLLFLPILLLPVLACSSSPTAPAGLEVSPATVTVESTHAVQLTVTGPGGGAVDGTVVWTSSNPVAAEVDANGVVTGGYANGRATITATAGAARGISSVNTIPRACLAIAPLSGTPDPDSKIQTFEIELDPGVDVEKTANEMAARFRFEILEILEDGFTAQLNPEQASRVQCWIPVAAMSYL